MERRVEGLVCVKGGVSEEGRGVVGFGCHSELNLHHASPLIFRFHTFCRHIRQKSWLAPGAGDTLAFITFPEVPLISPKAGSEAGLVSVPPVGKNEQKNRTGKLEAKLIPPRSSVADTVLI